MADEKQQQGRKPALEPFTVEFGDDNNSGRFALNVWQDYVRGRFVMAKVRHKVRQEMMAMPDIPGQRMKVTPRDMKVELFDPLEKDKNLLDRINATARRVKVDGGAGFSPLERVSKKLDVDEFKSLLLELVRKAAAGQCQVVDGAMPTEADVKRLDGRELYDVWNSNTRKPKYKDEVFDWERRLESQGV